MTPPRTSLPGLKTIWVSDPDGITNYFAETGQSRAVATRESGGSR